MWILRCKTRNAHLHLQWVFRFIEKEEAASVVKLYVQSPMNVADCLKCIHTEIRSTSATYSQLLLRLASCIVVQYIFISCWVSFRSFNAHIKFFSPSNNLIRNLQLIAYNWHLMPRIFSLFQFQKKVSLKVSQ